MELKYLIYLIIAIGCLLLIRLFGAWMLRIDEIISCQKEQLKELKRLNSKK
jgi:hypothetical protein